MSFKDEFDSAETGDDFSPLPEGEYVAEITDVQLDMGKTPARLSVVYSIMADGHKGRKLFGSYSMAGKGIGFCKKDMKTLGIDYSNIQKVEDVANLWYGKLTTKVKVQCKHRDYKGKTYSSVYLNEVVNGEELPF